MTYKVLLADDSETIKKVVKITLADESYELLDCSTSEELFAILKNENPAIVFLDFNLSEEVTGYELAKKINKVRPKTQILMMFGHFDKIDEELLKESGAANRIVKPFDSSRFINICKELVAELSEEDFEENFIVDNFEPVQVESSDEVAVDESDQLPLSSSDEFEIEFSDNDLMEAHLETNNLPGRVLAKDMAEDTNWETHMPPVIGGAPASQAIEDLPPIIPEDLTSDLDTDEFEEVLLPPTEDLEYPDLTDPQLVQEISADAFEPLDIDQIEVMSSNEGLSDKEIVDLEEEIADEISDHIWSPDGDLEFEIDDRLLDDQLSDNEDLASADLVDIASDNDHENSDTNLDFDELEERLIPIIDRAVAKYAKQVAEKVLWEIVPDIAEKVIKEEIHSLTRSIMDE